MRSARPPNQSRCLPSFAALLGVLVVLGVLLVGLIGVIGGARLDLGLHRQRAPLGTGALVRVRPLFHLNCLLKISKACANYARVRRDNWIITLALDPFSGLGRVILRASRGPFGCQTLAY